MLLVGLEEQDISRAASLLAQVMGDPVPAVPEDVRRVLTVLMGDGSFDA